MLGISTTFAALLIYVSFFISYKLCIDHKIVENVVGRYTLFSLIGILFLMLEVILFLLLESIWRDNYHSIIMGVWSFWEDRCNKWIVHDDLGYFFTSFSEENETISIYRQDFFGMKYVAHLGLPKDQKDLEEVVALDIKKRLDDVYTTKVEEIKKNKGYSSRINKLLAWDGYLDKVSRRDGKIDKILK